MSRIESSALKKTESKWAKVIRSRAWDQLVEAQIKMWKRLIEKLWWSVGSLEISDEVRKRMIKSLEMREELAR